MSAPNEQEVTLEIPWTNLERFGVSVADMSLTSQMVMRVFAGL
jgi:hypothetical protein